MYCDQAWGAQQFGALILVLYFHFLILLLSSLHKGDYDYNQYNIYSSIFASLSGGMAFLFGPLIGRVSDSYGRRPIFFMNIILSMAPFVECHSFYILSAI